MALATSPKMFEWPNCQLLPETPLALSQPGWSHSTAGSTTCPQLQLINPWPRGCQWHISGRLEIQELVCLKIGYRVVPLNSLVSHYSPHLGVSWPHFQIPRNGRDHKLRTLLPTARTEGLPQSRGSPFRLQSFGLINVLNITQLKNTKKGMSNRSIFR